MRPFSFAARCAADSLRSLLRVCSLSAKGFSRNQSAPFALSLCPCRLSSVVAWFSPCRPPCNPPAKPPFRATKRLILWGGLFRGKTHFRGGNLALLSPLRGGHGSIARLAAWRVRPKRHPQEKERRKGKQDNQPLQGALCACSGTKNSLIQRRVKGAKHREAARP